MSQSPPVGTDLTLLCSHQSEGHSTGAKGGKSMEVRKWKMEFGYVKETNWRAHAFNLNTMEAEAGRTLWVQDKLGQHSEFQTS